MTRRRTLTIAVTSVVLIVALVLLYWFAFTPHSVETGSGSGTAISQHFNKPTGAWLS